MVTFAGTHWECPFLSVVNTIQVEGILLWVLYKHLQGFKLAISNREDTDPSADGWLPPSLPSLGIWYFLRHILPRPLPKPEELNDFTPQ